MSEVSDLLQHYKEVRHRLRHPPNAVPDAGINLKRKEIPLQPEPEPLLLDPPPTVSVPPPEPPPSPYPIPGITFSSTLAVTAEAFGIEEKQIWSKSRKPKICFPRQVAVYVAAKQGKWSSNWIGRKLNLDHTSILHAKNKIASILEHDTSLQEQIQAIEKNIATRCTPTLTAEHKPLVETG